MVPGHITGKWNNQIITKTMDFGYHTSKLHDKDTDLLYTILISSLSCLKNMNRLAFTVFSRLCTYPARNLEKNYCQFHCT